jgi:hypothetical protein
VSNEIEVYNGMMFKANKLKFLATMNNYYNFPEEE